MPTEPIPDRAGEVGELVKLLLSEGAGETDHGIHGWRCAYPDRYGPCDCVNEMADAILESVWLLAHDAEVAAKALRDAADRMPAFHDRDVPEWAITSACRWLRTRADGIVREAGTDATT